MSKLRWIFRQICELPSQKTSTLFQFFYLILVWQRFSSVDFSEVGGKKIGLLNISLLTDMDLFHLESLLNWRKPHKMVFHRIWNQRNHTYTYRLFSFNKILFSNFSCMFLNPNNYIFHIEILIVLIYLIWKTPGTS